MAPPTEGDPQSADPNDLRAVAEAARAERRAEPESVPLWLEEAQAYEALGDYAGAIEALEGARGQLLAQDDTAQGAGSSPLVSPASGATSSVELGAIDERLLALRSQSRGTVADESASTHRQRLDEERATREAALNPAPPVDETPTEQPKKERIVKKWYFWVTILAIAASGAAVTGIAIEAARQDRRDDLDRSGSLTGGGASGVSAPTGALLRF